jgi:hypothetical protein
MESRQPERYWLTGVLVIISVDAMKGRRQI